MKEWTYDGTIEAIGEWGMGKAEGRVQKAKSRRQEQAISDPLIADY